MQVYNIKFTIKFGDQTHYGTIPVQAESFSAVEAAGGIPLNADIQSISIADPYNEYF